MAATRLIPLHINKGKTAAASIKDRIDYAEDPNKTENGNLVASYECDPRLAWQEFMLDRGRYLAAHVHNHILFNAVDLKAERKFRNFFLSTYAVRRLSDMICVEHGLSIIEEKPRREWQKRTTYKKELSHREILRMDLDEIMEKRPGSYDEFLLLLKQAGYEIKRGKQLSVRSKKMDRFIRFRSLGTGYSEAELQEEILKNTADGVPVKAGPKQPEYRFSLMKDFEQILQQKKGKGYERWAQHFNNTQAAEVLIFLQENDIDSYEKLDALAEKATDHFHVLSDEIKTCEARLKEIGNLKKAITDYSKTRITYESYRKAGYSKKFFEEHREEITIHKGFS